MPHHFSNASVRVCLAALGASITLAAQPAPANQKPQFDAASIKPAPATEPGRAMAMMSTLNMMPAGMIPMPDPGRVHIQGWPLRHLIAAAYRIRDDRVSGPSWMEDVRFDIEANLPEGAKRDDAHEMFQALLAERFGLELHRETHEQSGYALVVGKNGPKLEESAPPAAAPPAEPLSPEETQAKQRQQAEERMKALRAQMKSGPRLPGHSSTSWDSVTMDRFADRLSYVAEGPVTDETGLTGKYKIRIETWRSTDDDPGQTVFQAVEKLGLKLVPRKISTETLVIDKVSKTPTAN